MAGKRIKVLVFFMFFMISFVFGNDIKYVIHISVDGLRADIIPALGESKLPNFYRFKKEGVYTFNARPDAENTSTLPNHISMVVGRPVKGATGHNWTYNSNITDDMSIHKNGRGYITSIFDVVHDNGLRAAIFTGKSKLGLINQSYDENNGARDNIGDDNGRNKIDKFTYYYQDNSRVLSWLFINEMINNPFNYTLLHFADPDKIGHKYSWDITDGSRYAKTIQSIDELIGELLDIVEHVDILRNKTAIILTADHGGYGYGHGDLSKPSVYTIPFFVWGPGIISDRELYELNATTRKDPGSKIVSYDAAIAPIRSLDAANLALMLLGLSAIPGSVINNNQNLYIREQASEIMVMSKTSSPKFSFFSNEPISVYSMNGRFIKNVLPVGNSLSNQSLMSGLSKGMYVYKNNTQSRVIRVPVCQ